MCHTHGCIVFHRLWENMFTHRTEMGRSDLELERQRYKTPLRVKTLQRAYFDWLEQCQSNIHLWIAFAIPETWALHAWKWHNRRKEEKTVLFTTSVPSQWDLSQPAKKSWQYDQSCQPWQNLFDFCDLWQYCKLESGHQVFLCRKIKIPKSLAGAHLVWRRKLRDKTQATSTRIQLHSLMLFTHLKILDCNKTSHRIQDCKPKDQSTFLVRVIPHRLDALILLTV